MDESKFHFFSFGIVAANKKRSTDMVEVFPQEKFTMSVGELTDNVEKIDVKGKDASDQNYEGEIETKPSITCKWLPIGEPNRHTSPDVRRNEQVIIYRYADTEYYFWSTAFNNVIRKLETVAWWFSGTPKDGPDADKEKTPENGYLFEVSTHDGHIILSTSKANGEAAAYVLQLDTKNGTFRLQDDLGNSIDLDSVAGVLETTTENEVIHNTKKYTINCEEYVLNCKTSMVNASDSATYNTPIATFTGMVDINKLLTFKGGMKGSGGAGGGATASIEGKIDVTEDVVAAGVSLVNHDHDDAHGGKTGKANPS